VESIFVENIKLLGRQRAEFDSAKRKQRMATNLQYAIIVISVMVLIIPVNLVSYLGSILNLVLVLAWQYNEYSGKQTHQLAERARRMVLLAEGLGLTIGTKEYSDVMMKFTSSVYEGKKYEDPNYFKADESPGYTKLANMLHESSFWSKHLLDKSAARQWKAFGIALFISIVGLLLLSILSIDSVSQTFTQLFSLLLMWLVTGGILIRAIDFTSSARTIDDIEARLTSIIADKITDESIIVILGDYNAAMQGTPTIPTLVYKRNRDELNQLWAELHSSNHE